MRVGESLSASCFSYGVESRKDGIVRIWFPLRVGRQHALELEVVPLPGWLVPEVSQPYNALNGHTVVAIHKVRNTEAPFIRC